jgi:hypothetical protein
MTIKIMPVTRLISELDKYQYQSRVCCYSTCQKEPILSHTIAENFLYKLNTDLTQVRTFQPKMLPIATGSKSQLIPVNQDKFSTFKGFCPDHDNHLFKLIDLYDGNMTKEKAALIHYRNISYGICHIKSQQLREKHMFRQNYIQDKLSDKSTEKTVTILKNGALARRLAYCLNQHLLRKEQLEKIIKSQSFEAMEFTEVQGDLANPLFCGRSSPLLHPKHNFFNYPGYRYMPWVTYMTLLTTNKNHLIFCWLESDKAHAKYLKKLINERETNDIIAVLAYACSDALAVDDKLYNKHAATIEEIIKSFRVY